MSINVTVTGNPISIKRGKMVTSDSCQTKNEYEKRRLMRLEQVRQQSKDIAESVRNKVREEKKKQMHQIEEEGKQKLKNWQNRKLLELQTEYEVALKELGTGHKEATDFIDENVVLAEQKKHNDKIAAHRGQVAATQLQIEKNKDNLKKAIPIQKKKLVRDMENTRASLVSNIKKNKTTKDNGDTTGKTKKTIADINITIPSSDSECSEFGAANGENYVEQDGLSNDNENKESSTDTCDCIYVSDNNAKQVLDSDETNSSGQDLVSKSPRPMSPQPRGRTTTTGITSIEKAIQDRRKLIEEFQKKSGNNGPPLDTRISDRIKRRDLMASQPDYCDTVAKTHPIPFIESNTQLRDAVDARNINNTPVELNCLCGHKCPKTCGESRETKPTKLLPQEVYTEKDIPERPPIKLKDKPGKGTKAAGASKDTLETYDSHKVKYYDHPNRFSQEKKIPSKAHVEKIATDSIEVIPNLTSEAELQQKMKQRDKEAQIRGQKALKKEKIQKDYEDMLKKLPLLQKKERISEIAKDKQEYHMSDERLKERDRKKQNELDNAFSKLFPNLKPAIVTLPSKTQEKEVQRPVTDAPIQSLNIGNWDVDLDEPKMFTAEEVQNIVKSFTEQQPQDRRAKLKQLLRSLKLQKEQLINEIKSLPSNDSINELINDLRSFSDSDERSCRRMRKKDDKHERKRRRDDREKENSTDSTTESSSSSSTQEQRKIRDKHKGRHGSKNKTPSPRKRQKMKSRGKVLILQNMSTQTTPKVSTNSDQDKFEIRCECKTSKKPEQKKPEPKKPEEEMPKVQVITADKEKRLCPKLHIPCDCNKENESTEELCKIVIKINENNDPEVVVKSKEKNVIVPEGTGAVTEKSPKEKKTEMKSVGIGTEELKDTSKREKPAEKISSDSRKIADNELKQVLSKKHKSDTKVMEPKRTKVREVDTSDSKSSKAKSWREQLSKNSISTSSTSYFSPPDFQQSGDFESHSRVNKQSKQSFYNLHKKPQQGNIRDFSSSLSWSASQISIDQGTIDPKLVANIKRLLNMSRGSVENLTVSTSSIQTPSQSVIEMESNNPLAQLHNIIKYYTMKDIKQELSYSPDSVHYTSSVSTSEPSQLQPTPEKSTDPGGEGFSKSGKTDRSSRGTADKETSSCSVKSKDSLFAQYADITDSCSRRIAQLASMIEQIREEKVQMLQNPPAVNGLDKAVTTDKDYSTAYLDLPGSNNSSSKYSSMDSLDDDELQRRLLDIDFSLARKLRKFSSGIQDKTSEENVGEKKKQDSGEDITDIANITDKELWSRLDRLKQHDIQSIPRISSAPVQTQVINSVFVPFLSDIPKLPKLEPQLEFSKIDSGSSAHKRPPPSKGLYVAKKFNGNISLIPHELSTIAEADSQLSTKLGSANNSRTSQDISPQKEFDLVTNAEVQIAVIDDDASTNKHSWKSDKGSPSQLSKVSVASKEKDIEKSKTPPISPVILSSEGSNQSIILSCSKLSTSKKSLQMSSSSSDDMETIERMLKSIGMEWAIPTLHKTKEALALTSSSSSLELNASKQVMSKSISDSDVSLKQYLKKQNKISSSTLRSDESPANFSADLSELSSIQANNSNAEKNNQKMSTPVLSSTEKSGKKVTFSADSDISSIKDDTGKHSDKSGKTSFRSLGEYSETKSDT